MRKTVVYSWIRRVVDTVGRPWRTTAMPSIQDNNQDVSPAGVQIRAANAGELTTVLSMVGKICAFHQKLDPSKFAVVEGFAEKYGHWLRQQINDPRSVFLVATAEGQLAAFLVGTIDRAVPIYRVSTYGYIRDLWVEEDYRRTGIGRKMVETAIARFTQLGVKQVRLEIAAGNRSAPGFFESCGFRRSAIEMLIEEEADVQSTSGAP